MSDVAMVPAGAELPRTVLEAVLRGVTQAVIVTAVDGSLLYLNPAAEFVFSYSLEEVRGEAVGPLLFPPESRERLAPIIREASAGQRFSGELLMQDRAGQSFPVDAQLRVIKEDGEPAYLLGITADPSETRDSLRRVQILRNIASSYHDGMLVTEVDGTIRWANRAAEQLLGRSARALDGTMLEDLVAPENRAQLENARLAVLAGDGSEPIDTLVQGVDGASCEAQLTLSGYRDEQDEGSGLIVILRDVTEENATRRRLAKSEERLRAGFEQASVPQALLQLDGRILEVNSALERLLDQSREELLGLPLLDCLDSQDTSSRNQLLSMFSEDRPDDTTCELLARRGGTANRLLVDVSVLRDELGAADGLMLFARDLTPVRDAEERLARQAAFFRQLSRRASDLAIVTDGEINMRYVSPALDEMLGYDVAAVVGLNGLDFIHPDDQQSVRDAYAAIQSEAKRSVRIAIRVRHANGEWRWLEDTITNCFDDPDIGGVVTNLRDITAEVRAQEALRESEARYRAIVETAHEGIIAMTADGQLILANERLAELVGHDLEELLESGLWPALRPDDAQFLHRRLLSRQKVGPERYEISYPHPDGTLRTLSVSASPLVVGGGAIGSLAMVSDVTAERRATQELEHQALHDPLTGLANRALLADRLETAAARQSRGDGRGVALLFLDLDHLKAVNDSAGHPVGDALLVEVGRRLSGVVREADTVARIGGDEFAVVCEDTDLEGAVAVAERIQAVLAQPFPIVGRPLRMSASIGIAISPPLAMPDLLQYADAAMYAAKERARGCYVVFDHDLVDSSRRRLDVSLDLREALDEHRVELRYEPIVDLSDGRVRGLEAVLGWRHPTLGLLSADEVLDAAQDAGLAWELDRRVLQDACTELGSLVRRGAVPADTYVAVGITTASVAAEPVDVLVPEVLERSGLGPSQLVLEVTQTSVLTELDQATARLRVLDGLGVRVAVDDFGVGHGSLAHLHQLPLSILKVDRNLVAGLPDDPDSAKIVRTVLTLAEALGLHAIAEGVDSPCQAEVLRELGCRSGQGRLWGEPVAADELPGHVVKVAR